MRSMWHLPANVILGLLLILFWWPMVLMIWLLYGLWWVAIWWWLRLFLMPQTVGIRR